MDPEQTYLRVHARLSGMLSQLLTPGIRMALEFMYFTFAVAIFVLLFVMHANFVQQPGCASELSGVKFGEAQLVQIKISTAGLWTQTSSGWNSLELQSGVLRDNTGSTDIAADGFTVLSTKFWSNWFGSGSRRSKLIFKSWKNDKELLVPAVEKTSDITITKTIEHETNSKSESPILQIGRPISIREFILVEVKDFSSKLKIQFISFLKRGKEFLISASHLWKRAGWYAFLDFLECLRLLRFEDLKSLPVQYLEKKSRAIEPAYLYTTEKGYFLLPEVAKSHHNIQTVNITISAQSSCFGNRWQQLLINVFVGYDTILMNTLLSSPGHGYLYNYQTKEFYDLSYGQEASNGPTRFGEYFVTKCGVLIMSLFVFFTITMSVSFTLRETQSRMLRFTVQLQHHARNHLPTFQLIFVHVIESLVFVPIMIGILFFLFEFYDDQLLAILVLTLVWLCELFTMISVRTTISMQFFPRFFLLYFLVFHIYFFSYPYGFSYVAFSAMAAFMQHLILYFWNRFEVPALQRFMRTRAQLQHQTGVQITSSAIYTSTFHIARVSIPNRNPFGTEPTIATAETPARSDQASELDPPAVPFANNEAQEVPNLNPHQRTQPPPRPTNSLGSLLLSLLGGAHSESLFSLFSPSRDSQNQGQVYTEQTPQENQPLTT
ncbi:membralin-like protein At1g60995 [Zingiber officinale]|uniref:membralin-like protein At1g60995 n=1 Tax=Zingiber officinale TaxID=94328 RepID=UPI001C4AAF81|nr:membralin-like protein At1g60995 [Zingiber officinale]